MSLTDEGPSTDFDMFPTNRELARDSSLAEVIGGLEKIHALPDDQVKAALKKLVLKAPDSVKKLLSNFQQRDINSIRIGFNGLIRSLAYEGAEQVRWNAAMNVMNKLGQVAPSLLSFSTGH